MVVKQSVTDNPLIRSRSVTNSSCHSLTWDWLLFTIYEVKTMGPLQLVIHVVQNRNPTGEQETHWGNYHVEWCTSFVFLSQCVRSFALKHGGFVPLERLAVKGLFLIIELSRSLFSRHKAVGCYEAEVKGNSYTRKYQIKSTSWDL